LDIQRWVALHWALRQISSFRYIIVLWCGTVYSDRCVCVCVCSQGGWVVCEEDKDTLLAAWEDEIVEQQKREAAVSYSSSCSCSLEEVIVEHRQKDTAVSQC